MKFTRRALLAAGGALGLAGCITPREEETANEEESKQMTDRTPRHFNDNDELTSDVNNASVSTGEATIDGLSAGSFAGGIGSALGTLSPPIDISTGDYDFLGVLYPTPDKVVAVYRAGSSHLGNDAEIVKRESYDGGATWSSETTVFDSSYDDRNLAGGVTPTGRFVLFFEQWDDTNTAQIDRGYIYSDDEGDSWSSFTSISDQGFAKARPYGSLVETSGGDLLVPIYYQNSDGSSQENAVLNSTDDGSTWSQKAVIDASTTSPDHNETDITVLSNGNIIAVARRTDNAKFTQFSSTDDGSTWSKDGQTNFGTHQDVAPAVYSSGGEIRMIGTHRGNFHQTDGRLATFLSYNWADESTITGSPTAWDTYTWYVNTATYDHRLEGYPTVAEVNGEPLVMFSWNRNRDNSVNLSLIAESAIHEMIDGGEALRYRLDGSQTVSMGGHPRVISDGTGGVVVDTTTPATAFTTVDVQTQASGFIPSRANELIVQVELETDGTAGAESVVDVGSPGTDTVHESFSTPSATSGPAKGVVRTAMRDGVIEYQSTNCSSVTLHVLGWM